MTGMGKVCGVWYGICMYEYVGSVCVLYVGRLLHGSSLYIYS